jgi:hypothetical protein
MTKDKFRLLCAQVLVPRIGDLLHERLADIDDTLQIMAREMARNGVRLDKIIARMERDDGHANQGRSL